MKVWLLFFTTLLLLGCSSKKEKEFIAVYKEHKMDSRKLQKTEKIQLYDSKKNITKVLLTATYISKKQIQKKEKKDEVFIVGLYVDDNETHDVNLESFSLVLNGKSVKKIKVLKENSKLLRSIPFVFPWTQFYLVYFPHTANKRMLFKIKHSHYGEGTAYFAKMAKYVFHEKSF